MHDPFRVQITHALRYLLRDDRGLVHVELVLPEMYVGVQRHPLAEAADYSQSRRFHAGAHEKHEILVARLPESRHLHLELLQGLLVVQIVHVQEFDGDVPVPVAAAHGTEASATDHVAYDQLVERNVPLPHRQLKQMKLSLTTDCLNSWH